MILQSEVGDFESRLAANEKLLGDMDPNDPEAVAMRRRVAEAKELLEENNRILEQLQKA